MSDLTTTAAVKAYLGIQGNQSDAVIGVLVSAYSEAAEQYLNRDVLSQSYTELYSGLGGQRLVVNSGPVTAVSSLQILNDWGGAPVVVDPSELVFQGSIIKWTKGCFPMGLMNISITYTAGFASAPLDIAQAVTEWVALRFKTKEHIDYASKTLAGETVAFVVKDMPDTVRTVLNQYRRTYMVN